MEVLFAGIVLIYIVLFIFVNTPIFEWIFAPIGWVFGIYVRLSDRKNKDPK